MSRELTTPRPPQGPAGVEQNITAIRVDLNYEPDPPNGSSFQGAGSRFRYQITTVSADGEMTEEQIVAVLPSALPVAIINAVRTLITFADSDAESRGLIDPGTFTPPF